MEQFLNKILEFLTCLEYTRFLCIKASHENDKYLKSRKERHRWDDKTKENFLNSHCVQHCQLNQIDVLKYGS